MFDFEPGKLLIIGTVALLVIPAKDLPRVLRQAGQAFGKLRRMAGEFQSQFQEALRQADQEGMDRQMRDVADSTRAQLNFDPLRSIRSQVEGALSPRPAASAAEALEPPTPSAMADYSPSPAAEPYGDASGLAAPADEAARAGRAKKARAARQAALRAGRV